MIEEARNANRQKPWLQRTLFISGRLSLDFTHTGGPAAYKVFERLHTPTDLALWLTLCELSLVEVSVTKSDLQLAHELRFAIWKTANAFHAGKQPSSEDITIINQIAAAPPLVPILNEDGMQHLWKQPASAKAALATIARDAIDLFSHQDNVPIQQCANPICPLLFVDYSRPGKRRWCAMERCGNMAKIAKYRKNRKTEKKKP